MKKKNENEKDIDKEDIVSIAMLTKDIFGDAEKKKKFLSNLMKTKGPYQFEKGIILSEAAEAKEQEK